jgi:hypothetical protein
LLLDLNDLFFDPLFLFGLTFLFPFYFFEAPFTLFPLLPPIYFLELALLLLEILLDALFLLFPGLFPPLFDLD